MTIDRGESQVLKFPRRVKRISVNNPKIVEVVAVTPSEILLNAKAAGTTSLLVWDETSVLFTYSVIVQRDVKRIQEVAGQLVEIIFHSSLAHRVLPRKMISYRSRVRRRGRISPLEVLLISFSERDFSKALRPGPRDFSYGPSKKKAIFGHSRSPPCGW